MHQMKTWVAMTFVGLSAMSVALPVWACGAFFSEPDPLQLVDTADQRTVYVVNGTRVQQHVQVEYSGEVERLAWVYPISASAPPTVSEGSATIFQVANEASAPGFRITVPGVQDAGGGDSDCNIGCIAMSGALDRADFGDGGVEPPVDVWSTGQVGMLDYVVLSADSVEPLVTWLTDNEFAIPEEASPLLDHYVQGGWYFVAMRVSANEATSRDTSTSTVVFDFEAERPIFPLHMASMSSADSVGIAVYVIADQSYETSGMPTRTIDASELIATSPSETNYDSVFQHAVDGDGTRGFVREAVVDFSDYTWELGDLSLPSQPVLTRLRTNLDAADMTLDVTLQPTAEPITPRWRGPVYDLEYTGEARAARTRGAMELAGLGLFIFFSFRRLRRGGLS